MNNLAVMVAAAAVIAAAAAIGLQSAVIDPRVAAPSEATQADNASLLPPPAPIRSAEAPRCKNRLRVEIKTRTHPRDAGREVIAEWEHEARSQYGAEWANFKDAVTPTARCRQLNNDPEQSCWAEAAPCMSCEAIAAASGGTCTRTFTR